MRKIHDYDVQLSYTWEILCHLAAFMSKAALQTKLASFRVVELGAQMSTFYDSFSVKTASIRGTVVELLSFMLLASSALQYSPHTLQPFLNLQRIKF